MKNSILEENKQLILKTNHFTFVQGKQVKETGEAFATAFFLIIHLNILAEKQFLK